MKTYLVYRRIFMAERVFVEVEDNQKQPDAIKKAKQFPHDQFTLQYRGHGGWYAERVKDRVQPEFFARAETAIDDALSAPQPADGGKEP